MKTLVLLLLYSIDISGQRTLTVTELPSMAVCHEMRESIVKQTSKDSNGAPIINVFNQNLICQEVNVLQNYQPEFYKVRVLSEPQK